MLLFFYLFRTYGGSGGCMGKCGECTVFEAESEKDIRITRGSNSTEELNLSEDEKIVYEILKDAMLGKDSITPKEFSKYASKEYDTVYVKLNRIEDVVKKVIQKEGMISEEKSKVVKEWNSKFGLYFLLAMLSLFIVMFLPGLIVGLFVIATTCKKNANCISILTDEGTEEVAMWKGLKKYMEDYSMLSDKLVIDNRSTITITLKKSDGTVKVIEVKETKNGK